MAVVNKPLSGQRILVVEDEMLVLMETQDMLADLGCDSIVAAATKNGISPATTDRYLKRLSEAGVIACGNGLYWLKTT